MDKYSKPNLPSPRSVLEDLCAADAEDMTETIQFTTEDKSLREAYNIYLNYKQLRSDINKQQVLNGTLEELNKELMDNIENMRKQQSANR